jgi:hypothetical protein
VDYVAYDDWDYDFRYGIYDDYYYHRGDIDIDRGDWPDRPRPPIADGPRPTQPIYRPPGSYRPSAGARPSGGRAGGAGSLRGGGGGRGGGRR